MAGRRGNTFTPATTKRLAEVTRYVEQQPRSRLPDDPAPNQWAGPTMLLVTTALNPMVGATPGANGRGKIQKLDGTSYSDHSSTVYPILNDQEKTVAVGAYVLCLPGPGGKFHMIMVDKCSRLS